eukprot:CAMPEP_0202893556 /NCGR_PEP_ID=MMETSP1392-20130828/3114_1 /ASSEMBLY_ACC=CAM_ASM_000868 /TAXON_ID=225041 /ORGANISM="Chlamydomonas chlamydogama, Strain SAG 11-48b" /LENGTH=166 /DNA_ID=CAMNT_0049577929 /DNA_START=129 /DNA_END=629 /DNA_ORIENTATION=-
MSLSAPVDVSSGHHDPPGPTHACGFISERKPVKSSEFSAILVLSEEPEYDPDLELLPDPRQATEEFLVGIGLQPEKFKKWLAGWFGMENPDWNTALAAYFAHYRCLAEGIDPVNDMMALGITEKAAQWAATVEGYGHRAPARWAEMMVQAELGRVFRSMWTETLQD